MAAERVPAGLSKRAGALWRAVLGEYELGAAERELLRHACIALDRADDAAAIVKREGAIVADRYGTPKAHPATDIEARSRAGFAAIVKQLGMELDDDEDPSVASRQARKAATARWGKARATRTRRGQLRGVPDGGA